MISSTNGNSWRQQHPAERDRAEPGAEPGQRVRRRQRDQHGQDRRGERDLQAVQRGPAQLLLGEGLHEVAAASGCSGSASGCSCTSSRGGLSDVESSQTSGKPRKTR